MVSVTVQTKREYGIVMFVLGLMIFLVSIIAKLIVQILAIITLIVGILLIFNLDTKLEKKMRGK